MLCDVYRIVVPFSALSVEQRVLHPPRNFRIEICRRLVEQQQLRIVHECFTHSPTRVFSPRRQPRNCLCRASLVIPETVRAVGRFLLARLFQIVDAREDLQVLEHRQPEWKRGVRRREVHLLEDFPAMRRHRLSENADAPRGRRDQSEDHMNRRGLAGPVRPEHPDDLAALDSEADVIDRAKFPERLAQIFNFYQHRITCLLRECAFSSSGKNKTATECMHPWPSEAFLLCY